jgi:hypothetical protein
VITKQATIWAGVGAVLALGFAGYATVRTDNEVGTAAFVLVGLYLTIVAITGRAPRVRHGESEIDPRAVQAAADRTAEVLGTVAAVAAEGADDPKEVAAAVQGAASNAAARSASWSTVPASWTVMNPAGQREMRIFRDLPADLQLKLFKEAGFDHESAITAAMRGFDQWPADEQERIVAVVRRFVLVPLISSRAEAAE